MSARRVLSLLALMTALGSACTLSTSFDGLVGEPLLDGGIDATDRPDGLTAVDAVSPDAPGVVDGGDAALSTVPVIATPVGVALFATGTAQQTHLHYAKNAARWVLFYLDSDTSKLKTRTSSDFATWTDGVALALNNPHPGDGRSFAVTYDDLAGRDVFHVSYALKASPSDRRHHHARGVITAGTLAFEPSIGLGRTIDPNNQLEPDGPAVLRVQGGTVIDFSGWFSPDSGTSRTGNAIAWLSSDSDLGASWAQSFGGPIEVQVVPNICNARALVPLAAGALGVWESADVEPNPTALMFSRFNGTTWGAASPVDAAKTTFHVNDWGLARIDDTHIHAVRFAGGTFTDRVYDGSTWADGAVMPAAAPVTGEGLVVLADAGTARVFILDATGAILTTSLTGGAWSAWTTSVPAAAGRSGLSGYAGAGGAALLWMDKSTAVAAIAAIRIR